MSLTTDPTDPELGRGSDPGKVPQNKKYLVLSDEELAQGFVRPVRTKYIHVGRRLCGKPEPGRTHDDPKKVWVCAEPPGHEGECFNVTQEVPIDKVAEVQRTHTLGGCGVETRMAEKIAQTYARNPKFYGATYCVGCERHLPVSEFVWSDTDEIVGS